MALALVVVGGLAAAVTPGEEKPAAASPAASPETTASSTRPAPSAQQVAARLADLYLPNMRDNSAKRRSIGVVGLITTDAVSVYQWRDETLAKRWAHGSADKIRIGVFVLSFVGSEQQMTSQEARRRMAAEVRKMVARG